MRVKLGTAIERVDRVLDVAFRMKGMIALKDFNETLKDKEKKIKLLNPPGQSLGERMTKIDALAVWMGASRFRQKSDVLNLRASRFRALNTQIKVKVILNRIKKVLKKEKLHLAGIHQNIQRKVYMDLYWRELII